MVACDVKQLTVQAMLLQLIGAMLKERSVIMFQYFVRVQNFPTSSFNYSTPIMESVIFNIRFTYLKTFDATQDF